MGFMSRVLFTSAMCTRSVAKADAATAHTIPEMTITDSMIRERYLYWVEFREQAPDEAESLIMVSFWLLGHYLGDEWIQTHVFGTACRPSAYMRPHTDGVPRINADEFNELRAQ